MRPVVLLVMTINFFLSLKSVFSEIQPDVTVVKIEAPETVNSYKPFEFAYQSDDGFGTMQHRREESNADGTVKGTYGYVDTYGLYRAVEYVADANGFRAIIKTNEPGTDNQNTADALWVVHPPPYSVQQNLGYQRVSTTDVFKKHIENVTANPTPTSTIPNTFYGDALRLPFPVLSNIVGAPLPPKQSVETKIGESTSEKLYT